MENATASRPHPFPTRTELPCSRSTLSLTPTNLQASRIRNFMASVLKAAILQDLRGWDNGDVGVEMDHLRLGPDSPA